MLYEKRILMASLDLRTTLKFCELPYEQGIIKIQFPAVNLLLSVPLEIVQNFFLSNDARGIISQSNQLVRAVKYFITVNGMWCKYEQRFSLQLFFLLLYSIVYNEKLQIRSFHVDVSTDLPIGGGLGSSTSFAVCLAACFVHWARLQKGDHAEFDWNDLNQICNCSTICEELVQDFAYVIDNYACTFGRMIDFQYFNFDYFKVSIMDITRIRILLINSKIWQNKRERLQQMAEIKYFCPEDAKIILDEINVTSQNIYETLYEVTDSHENHPVRIQKASYAQLQKYIQESQLTLQNSYLSHPRLDNICSIAKSHGFAGKLTGFGGGFVYVLLPATTEDVQIWSLSAELVAQGFGVTRTSLSCSGVRID
ncbi:mevalonate kinase [Lasius niger]|uniref:Mevalonate kinase n=1 Tax=Lasius niger TaxID=67767 RepID=A0A0J7MTW4_LASNI|nr:mevalonate kinase [Lasius niger]